jgi:hypothetical protein
MENREVGENMQKKNHIIFLVAILLIWAKPALPDCTDLGTYTSWTLEDSHRIVFYRGKTPIARLNIPDCEIHRSSKILLDKGYVCDSDTLTIDGEECWIMTVEVLY